jgi:hypothetical protein
MPRTTPTIRPPSRHDVMIPTIPPGHIGDGVLIWQVLVFAVALIYWPLAVPLILVPAVLLIWCRPKGGST